MKKVLCFGMVIVMALVLVACGGDKTAQDYLDAHDADELRQLKEMTRNAGMELSITASGDTVIYTYRYLEEMDVEATRAYMDTMSGVLKAGADIAIAEMKEFGVSSPVIRYVYQNIDGAQIWSGDFK
jgi:hypothetical protein